MVRLLNLTVPLLFALQLGSAGAQRRRLQGNSGNNGNNKNTATATATTSPADTAAPTTPPAWLGLNLYEVASRGIAFPTCGDIGQNESFQGAALKNAKGECMRVNICHGNAGFGWNRITVDRSALGVDNKGNGGHANQEHNDRSQKRPDYFPGAISIANPRGAGINGGLDGNCNFVDANGNVVEKSEEEPATPAPVVPAVPAPQPAPLPGIQPNTIEAPDANDPTDETTPRAFARGDPHFKTFGGELYDYHGQCDLLLLDNPQFKNGLGMTIHIRTKIQDFWSSVESAAIKIGDDIIEVAGGVHNEWLWVNGEANGELEEAKWNRFNIAGFLVRFKQTGETREVNIYIEGHKEYIMIKAYKDFVRIDIPWMGSANFEGSTGLLGSHVLDGQRVGRDGVTFIEDVNAFGQEWQVLEAEDKLFHNYDSNIVQAPAKCVLPPAISAEQQLRRLAESDLNRRPASMTSSQPRMLTWRGLGNVLEGIE
jgi:hypothetical protein